MNPSYIKNIVPFILINKVNQITAKALIMITNILPKDIISKLIYNLHIFNNDLDLPHQINNILIKHEMYLELIDLNIKFHDHFTPLAVLVSAYLQI